MEKCVEIVESSQTHFYQISAVYMGLPFIVFGLIANSVSVVTWHRLIRSVVRRNTSCGFYLMVIAYADNFYLISFFFVESLPYLVKGIFRRSYTYNLLYAYLGFPFYIYLVFLTFWLLAGLAVCRMLIVIYPMRLRQVSIFQTKTAIGVVCVMCFAVNLPNFFAFKPVNSDNRTCLQLTQLFIRKSFFNYRFWFQCLMLTILPWTTVTICSFVIWCRQRLPKHPMASRQGKEMGHLLKVLLLMFIVLVFWQCIAQCFWLHKPTHKVTNYSFAFGKLGSLLNSCLKLPVCYAHSRTFRRCCNRVVWPRTSYKPNVKLDIVRNIFRQNNTKRCSLNAISPFSVSNYCIYMSELREVDSQMSSKLGTCDYDLFLAKRHQSVDR